MKQNKTKVFLDMDGVLTDFTRGWTDILGLPYAYSPYPFEIGVWDYFPELLREYNVTFERVDDVCTHDFWANLPWMHDGRDILEAVLSRFDYENVYLLTSPMPNLGSPSGKWEWVERNIPSLKEQVIITNASKGLFAGPDRVLIDDKNENVQEFHRAGGEGIFCPRPWNAANMFDTIPFIRIHLEEICGQTG